MARLTLFAGLLAVVATISGCDSFGTKLTFKKGELYYTQNVDEAQARKLGGFLVEKKYFTDDKAVTVQLDRQEGTFQVRMVVVDDYQSKTDVYPKSYRIMAALISEDVFDGSPVEIHLTDNRLKTHEVVQPDAEFAKLLKLTKQRKHKNVASNR
jgi:hypothetical protein